MSVQRGANSSNSSTPSPLTSNSLTSSSTSASESVEPVFGRINTAFSSSTLRKPSPSMSKIANEARSFLSLSARSSSAFWLTMDSMFTCMLESSTEDLRFSTLLLKLCSALAFASSFCVLAAFRSALAIFAASSFSCSRLASISFLSATLASYTSFVAMICFCRRLASFLFLISTSTASVSSARHSPTFSKMCRNPFLVASGCVPVMPSSSS
mmetsp:Transcript_20479/g.41643  ORF Transcript_20479/g.41643 Transcript_20479/m.41643 type:complete len:212 (+) Transcript_20479:480-1115(+)